MKQLYAGRYLVAQYSNRVINQVSHDLSRESEHAEKIQTTRKSDQDRKMNQPTWLYNPLRKVDYNLPQIQ